jgi:hypothetical protein
MLKKIMLSIVAAVVLIGAEDLIAQERRGRPEARARQRQKGQAEQPRRQRTDREALREHAEQVQQQRATKEARRERMESLRGKPQPIRPGQNQPGFPQGGVPAQPGQMFGRWLDELTKAYRADDKEEMGQLIKKMHQLRQRWQKVRGLGFQHRGMIGGWGRGFQGRGIGGWGHGWQGRGIGRRGQSFRGRDVGRPGPGIPPPSMEEPEPPEDVDRPSPPMPPRGMGGRGRGLQRRGMGRWGGDFPSPWCPWLRFPRPETD